MKQLQWCCQYIVYVRDSQPCLAHTALSPFVRMSFPLFPKAVFNCLGAFWIICKYYKNFFYYFKLVYIHLQLYMNYFYNGVLEMKWRLKILKDIWNYILSCYLQSPASICFLLEQETLSALLQSTQLWNEYQVGTTSWRVFSVMSSLEE